MSSESTLTSFLRIQVPEWSDDAISRTLFKAFGGQRSDWEARFQIWKDLIIAVARHLQLIVIDTNTVKHKWFLRGGLTPLCMDQVLVEMRKSGDLQSLNEVARAPTKFEWLLAQIGKGVSLAGHTLIGMEPVSSNSIEGYLVVTALLQERVARVTGTLSDNLWSSCCVTTVSKFINHCGGIEEADIVKSHLMTIGRAKYFLAKGDSLIEGLKISLSSDHVPNPSKLDHQMLTLYWTMEKLQTQLEMLEKQAAKSKAHAFAALQSGSKQIARRHLQTLRSLSASKLKCENFQQRIDDVLSLISEAETTRKVSEAITLGANAIKEHGVTLEDVHKCLNELDDALLIHKDIDDTLGSFFATKNGEDDEDYDRELACLELESLKEQNLCTASDNLTSDSNSLQTEKYDSGLQILEHDLAGLKLKHEPAEDTCN